MLRARAWRVLASPVGSGDGPPPLPLPDADTPPPALLGETFGYAHAVEWRWAVGGWEERGPATVWTRMRIPVVEGEEPTPRQRVMVVADSGNGASNVLDWGKYLFINTELTVHFVREPVGEWVCLDAETQIAEGGAGLARTILSDRRDRLLAARRRCSSRDDDPALVARHERHRAAGGALRPRPAGASSAIAAATARSTAFISNSAKLAPRQRRTPPPNGIHV